MSDEDALPPDSLADPLADAHAPDPRIGQIVAERYRLVSLIAEGGMGRVYRAQHVSLNEPLVVKFLHPLLAWQTLVQQRFRMEAKTLIRLRHPGIVAIHDYGEHDGIPYIALELVEGETLSDLVLRTGRLHFSEAFGIFEQLLDVLVVTHAAGVIHRDLKPDNIMVGPRSQQRARVTVLDFGIARLADDEEKNEARLTRTGAVFGTPTFMAPEQCRGRTVSPETDVYSVGVMLFWVLTGELPFAADSTAELFAKQLYVMPPTLRERGAPADLPPGLESLVARALAKKAVDRPSAAEFLHELRAIAAGEDGATRSGRVESARLVTAWQTRSERVAAFSGKGLQPRPTLPAVEDSGGRVAIWGFSSRRAATLVDVLAVNGMDAVRVDDEVDASAAKWPAEPSPGVVAVLLAGAGWESRLRQLRPPERADEIPVLVADIAISGDIPALVRAGASDVALSTIPDEALVAKLSRLIRRNR